MRRRRLETSQHYMRRVLRLPKVSWPAHGFSYAGLDAYFRDLIPLAFDKRSSVPYPNFLLVVRLAGRHN